MKFFIARSRFHEATDCADVDSLPKIFRITAVACLILLAGCATNVRVDFERSADFANYRTFEIDPRAERTEASPIVLSEIVDRRVESALRGELKSKGLTVASESPDLRVNFFTVTRTRTEVIDHSPIGPRGFGRYPRGYYSHVWFRDFEIHEYEEGTLVVDLIDRERDQLVWRGTYTRRVGWSAPDKETTRKMIALILAAFPPEK